MDLLSLVDIFVYSGRILKCISLGVISILIISSVLVDLLGHNKLNMTTLAILQVKNNCRWLLMTLFMTPCISSVI